MEGIVALAKEKGVDAIHPGYGFLSENPALPRACERAGITFIGPSAELLELLGDKTAARRLAQKAGIPVRARHRRAGDRSQAGARRSPASIGFPLIVKAAFGGGGRGMRVVDQAPRISRARWRRRGAKPAAAFGNDAVFLERFMRRARTSKCRFWATATATSCISTSAIARCSAAIRRWWKWRPRSALDPRIRAALADAAVTLARAAGYYNAGTVEFLVDADTGEWYFIEVNPRIQVEHTVTEMVTGIDLVRCQIQVAQGLDAARPGNEPAGAGRDAALRLRAAMPHHHGRSGQQLRSRLRQDSHLPLAGRLRHPAGRRHRRTAAR